MNIEIKYKNGVAPCTLFSQGDWIDLRASEDITIKKGEYRAIPLGVAMAIPKGYEALVVPRSSTFAKYGIIQTNSVGVIDESYRGDNDWWHFPVIATRDTFIPKNDRICQFRLIKHQPDLCFVVVEELGNEDRGGFGSTGSD